MTFKKSELILNDDGSVYHLNLKPGQVATDIIFVGDQDRVSKITDFFDTIEFTTQKREFKTTTGIYKKKRLTVISTGIGTDNIDIVLNELDALFNINLQTRTLQKNHTALNIIRIGTSGALQKNIALNSFLISTFAVDLTGLLQAYQIESIQEAEFETAFCKQTNWSPNKAKPVFVKASKALVQLFTSKHTVAGITATASGFYAPQGRVLRLPLQDKEINNKLVNFNFNTQKLSNLEMETAGIYGLAKLLGHNAISLNAIIANRATGEFSYQPEATITELITYCLTKLAAN